MMGLAINYYWILSNVIIGIGHIKLWHPPSKLISVTAKNVHQQSEVFEVTLTPDQTCTKHVYNVF